jgi:hypothetical protein
MVDHDPARGGDWRPGWKGGVRNGADLMVTQMAPAVEFFGRSVTGSCEFSSSKWKFLTRVNIL